MEIGAQDKLNIATFLESSKVALIRAQAALPLVQDDCLKKIIESGITATEAQVKGVQQWIDTHAVLTTNC